MTSTTNPAERLETMFDAHYGRLYRLARRLVPSADDALDLVQETFLRAARSPNAVPAGTGKEEAWLVRVLVNIRRDQWRHAAVHHRFHKDTRADASEIAREGHATEDPMIARATIWKALDQLPPRRRAIIVMHELDGLDVSSIAAMLGVSSITVRWHLSRGRQELAIAVKSDEIQRIGGMA